jgi:hypothetical protein
MAQQAPAQGVDGPPLPISATLTTGYTAVGVAFLWSYVTPAGIEWRFLLALAGLVAIGADLIAALRKIAAPTEARLLQAGRVLLASLAAFLAAEAVTPGWDSIAMLLTVVAGFALLGACLVAMPWKPRAMAISVLAVVHLAGIFNAIVNVPPLDQQPPWLANMAFMHFYRPWQLFTHLTNSYHFYSPDPGPVALVYFHVEYADGSARWIRFPDHKTTWTGLETRRYGALASSMQQWAPVTPLRMEDVVQNRVRAGEAHKPPIPLVPEMPPGMQYREPGPQMLLQIASYVRHVGETSPNSNPNQAITGIKVFKVDFHNPRTIEFATYKTPDQVFDPMFYQWQYLGEYTTDGKLKPSSLTITYNDDGSEKSRVQDPFLYFFLPVLRKEDGSKVTIYARVLVGDTETEKNP